MAEIIQGQEPEAFPPSTPGNGPQSRGTKQSFVADPIKDTPSGQTSIRKGAGPRTAQVAERSKLKGSEPNVDSFGSGNGHSRAIPGTVPPIPGTVSLTLSSSNRTAASQPGPTAIDFVELKDGSLVDIVEDPQNSRQTLLAVWKDGIVNYRNQLNWDGRQLIPLPRTGEIMQHVRLPRGAKPYKSTASLVYELAKLIQRCVSVKEDNLLPLVSFVLTTWIADRLDMAPYLSITGLPQSGKTTLLRILGRVCRRALLLADITPAAVHQAYGQLNPTLLIDDCDPTERSRELRQLLRMGTTPDFSTARNNKLVSVYGMKAIVWNEPPNDHALNTRCIQIEMVETNNSDLASITDEEMEEQTSELQAQLLQFRFERYNKVRIQALPDEDRLRGRSRDLLRCLAAPYVDEPKVCERLAGFFRERDILKREPLPRPESVVLAVLFSEIHQKSYSGLIPIKDLTESVNNILKGTESTYVCIPERWERS